MLFKKIVPIKTISAGYDLFAPDVHSYINLARISHEENNIKQAKEYYETVKDLADDGKRAEKEAKQYLKKYRKV